MTFNVELAAKMRDRILDVPAAYDQRYLNKLTDKSPCGAAGCLAGEAIICNAPSVREGVMELQAYRFTGKSADAFEKAASLLGLDSYEADLMFRADSLGWASPFDQQFADARTDEARAQVAAAYLQAMIDAEECQRR